MQIQKDASEDFQNFCMYFWHFAFNRCMIVAILIQLFNKNLLTFQTFVQNEYVELINLAFANINFGDSQTLLKMKVILY